MNLYGDTGGMPSFTKRADDIKAYVVILGGWANTVSTFRYDPHTPSQANGESYSEEGVTLAHEDDDPINCEPGVYKP